MLIDILKDIGLVSRKYTDLTLEEINDLSEFMLFDINDSSECQDGFIGLISDYMKRRNISYTCLLPIMPKVLRKFQSQLEYNRLLDESLGKVDDVSNNEAPKNEDIMSPLMSSMSMFEGFVKESIHLTSKLLPKISIMVTNPDTGDTEYVRGVNVAYVERPGYVPVTVLEHYGKFEYIGTFDNRVYKRVRQNLSSMDAFFEQALSSYKKAITYVAR